MAAIAVIPFDAFVKINQNDMFLREESTFLGTKKQALTLRLNNLSVGFKPLWLVSSGIII